MLCLSRRAGESIKLGDDTYITVLRIGPNSCRIGIEAPRSVNIARTELLDAPPPAEASCEVDQPDMGGEGGGHR